ncbi:N-acetyl-LL-diaminopimelate aminotransferase [Oceanobacillus picturae]|uniref:Aminotransferase n=1 Tax=Oceanobacillus picturae TaxID=171693 RepID=W9A9G6_9BACI|nr:aminotransferase A [Oceanobacillus picturae]RIU96529.1 aminotransferase A [Oceanobacillus picturae]GAQ18759.1 N-acetyl-LL-diaminopimelate aminotransferase [Oceanobacillus picturae]CDO02404.1 Putative N-acetyl-LL-diaminopimelate aminotransferase [Oceanobacillus picturae]
MEHMLNHKLKQIEISGIRKFFNMVADEEDVISLTIGQPDFHTPEHIKQAAVNALSLNRTGYTHNAGILELRKAIAAYNEEKYHISYDPDKEIIVTTGASQAIDITFRGILNSGDEVILPGPIYPGYEPLITLAGAKAVYADTTKDAFKLTKENLVKHITNKTKCVVLPYPSNPTGASFTKEELNELVSVLKDKDIFILADEIYSELVYERPHYSIAAFESIRDKTIVINGLSKSHSMTGFRIGYLLAPSWLAKELLKVHQYNVSCASSISQYAALEALTNGKNDTLIMQEAYNERREYVYKRLVSMGLSVNKPEGAFYFFPKFPMKEMDSFQLGLELVRKGKVALVPGSSFSVVGEGYMRLSYAYDLETIKKALDRLEGFLQM